MWNRIKDFFLGLFGCTREVHYCPICGAKCFECINATTLTYAYLCDCGTKTTQYEKDAIRGWETRFLYDDVGLNYYECCNETAHNQWTITYYQTIWTGPQKISSIRLPEHGFSGQGFLDLGDTNGLWELIHLNQWMAP